MSFKFVLAISIFCCFFLEPSNAQTQYDQLKWRDRNKPLVPLPTLRPQYQPPINQQNNQQNVQDRPLVPQPTPRPQNQPPYNPLYPNLKPNQQQPNNNQQNVQDRPLVPQPTSRPQNQPPYNPLYFYPNLKPNQQQPNWHDIYNPLGQLQTLCSQIQQQYYQSFNNYLHNLNNLNYGLQPTPNPNPGYKGELTPLAANVPDKYAFRP